MCVYDSTLTLLVCALQLKQSKRYLRDGEERFKEALTILDYRFFLIPLMFGVLRMWTCMVYLFKIYIQLKGVPYAIRVLMFYLSVSKINICSYEPVIRHIVGHRTGINMLYLLFYVPGICTH